MLRLLTIGLLLSTVWVFHSTMPQKNIVYIPATGQDIKLRPAGFDVGSIKVVSLEQAERLYEERWGKKEPELYLVDNSECWFNDCDLEWTIRLAKFELFRFLST
jgi:hypothetical protein